MGTSLSLHRGWAVALAACVSLCGGTALAGQSPKLLVMPFGQGDGVPDRSGAKLGSLLLDELKTRDEVEAQAPSEVRGRASEDARSAAQPKPAQPSPEAAAALSQGKKALDDLRFDDAVAAFKKGIDASLRQPGSADYAAVYEALVSSAVAYFRMGEEKRAQAALYEVARMDPAYKLEGGFPPVFVREFEKAKKKVEKAAKANLVVEGPPGSTAFIDGRDLGMVPVEEKVTVGTHWVKVEGPRGERFGQVLELKASGATVKGSFGGAEKAAPPAPAPVAELLASASLVADDASRAAAIARSASADFVVVGYLYRIGSRELSATAAIFSARRQGFASLSTHSFDDELLTANAAVFKLADDVVHKVGSFGPPSSLPINLEVKPVRTASASSTASSGVPGEPDVELVAPKSALRPSETRKPAETKPEEPNAVRAFTRKSTMETDQHPSGGSEPGGGPKVKGGTPAWIWVVVGVGVAAAAGGTYFGVSEMTKPVTGTVTARW
ncbi:MAG: hypothetical protein HYZ28_03360 [Myxococcales bacterium]|nr:hypothetical protein [Myxococcales bacterium]